MTMAAQGWAKLALGAAATVATYLMIVLLLSGVAHWVLPGRFRVSPMASWLVFGLPLAGLAFGFVFAALERGARRLTFQVGGRNVAATAPGRFWSEFHPAGDSTRPRGQQAGRALMRVFLVAPWLVYAAVASFAAARFLRRAPLREAADVLLELLQSEQRLPVAELEQRLGAEALSAALPVVVLLPGVHVFTRDFAALALTDELRRELAPAAYGGV
jgi:hypothetical protein